MTAIKGRKQLTYYQRQKLFRNTPRNINSYSNATIDEHRSVLESFERDDYQLYEKLMHSPKPIYSPKKTVAQFLIGPEISAPGDLV